MKKSIIPILLGIFLIVCLVLIVQMIIKKEDVKKTDNEVDSKVQEGETKMNSNVIYAKVNDSILEINLENNSSAKALVEKLKENDITINMNDYSNFEKVGDLGFDLPRNDKQIDTDYGDVILYQGNRFVIYYDKNSWSFTKLGHINLSKTELKNILGDGDVTITLSLE